MITVKRITEEKRHLFLSRQLALQVVHLRKKLLRHANMT